MSNQLENETVSIDQKLKELCQHLVADSKFAAAQQRIEIFEKDEAAQEVYHDWQTKASELQHRYQTEGLKPSPKELSEMETLQKKVAQHPAAADFVEANDAMSEMFSTVVKTVQKTFQLGRMPTEEELNECCGSGG